MANEPFHSGGFVESDEIPTFDLDGEQASEFCLSEGQAFRDLIDELIKANAWFMATPPYGGSDQWTIYVQLNSVALVGGVLAEFTGTYLTRGLHTADDDEDPESE